MGMKIRTRYDPKPISTNRFDWTALDEDTYDGSPDSLTRGEVGYGASESDAIEDLLILLEENRNA